MRRRSSQNVTLEDMAHIENALDNMYLEEEEEEEDETDTNNGHTRDSS